MARQNLVIQSETVDTASWTKTASSVTANAVANPLDGAVTADAILDTGASSAHGLTSSSSFTVVPGVVYTWSVYVKAAKSTTPVVLLAVAGALGGNGCYFNLVTGARTDVLAAGEFSNAVNVGNGWWRIWVTGACHAGASTSTIGINPTTAAGSTTYTGDGTASCYVYGAQMVQANWPGDYIATTTVTIGPNTPLRNKVSPVLQNLCLQSEAFDNASWTKTNLSATADQVANPLTGAVTADAIVENGANAGHNISQNVAGVSVGANVTFSVFLKAGTRNWTALIINSNASNNYCFFDLTNGVLGTKGSGVSFASITPVQGQAGWYQCVVNGVQVAGSTGCTLYLASADNSFTYTGTNGNVSVYAWGAQVVQANWPGVYQATTSVAVGATNPPRNVVTPTYQNLLTQSEDFNTTWTKNNTTVSTNTTVNPVDGLTTADTITDTNDGGAVNHYVQQTYTAPTPGSLMTWSIYLKGGTKTQLFLYGNLLTTADHVMFDTATGLSSGLAGTNGLSADMFALPNGWYRCSFTFKYDSGQVRAYMGSGGSATYQGAGTGTLVLFGGQLVQANWAGIYQATTATTVGITLPPRNITSPVNLVLRSEDLANASWTKGTGITATTNTTDVSDPLGGSTASRLVYDGSGSVGGIRLQQTAIITTSPPIGTALVSGVWLRISSGTRVMGINGNSTGVGTFTVTTSWQLFVIPLVTNTVANFFFNIVDGAGLNSAFTLYVWGVQSNRGVYLDPYVKTTSAQIGVTNVQHGLLPGAQNLALQSEDFSNSFYTKVASSITTDQVPNPIDGAVTADAIVDTVSSTQHYIQLQSLGVTLGNVYTLSVFAKAAAQSILYLQGSSGLCFFDLVNGITGSPGASTLAYGMIPMRNGWYRCWISFVCNTLTGNFIEPCNVIPTFTYVGTGTAALYIWGAQVNQGLEPLSYIQTVATVVDKGALRRAS